MTAYQAHAVADCTGGERLDRPHEECGVIGVYAPQAQAARKAYFGLFALQHRGQESSGMATLRYGEGDEMIHHYKAMGLVNQIYSEDVLTHLPGDMMIGHNRYSTTGGSNWRNAAPHVIETLDGMVAVAHNGNITNAAHLRRQLLSRGIGLMTSTDSELLTMLLAMPLQETVAATTVPTGAAAAADPMLRRLHYLHRVAEGAFSLVVLTAAGIYATRDRLGMRPLCVGLASQGGQTMTVFASESCALQPMGATWLRDIAPGEIVRLDSSGLHVLHTQEAAPHAPSPKALCVFEYVYFARPDSQIEQRSVYATRVAMGRALWQQAPVEADIVVGVPDSAVPCALGLSYESGIPYVEGLTKNRYIGRTFIQPDDSLRKLGVRLKFTPLSVNIAGKRLILVDDSIVRGNTVRPLIALLRDAGARAVHVRVSSPAVRHPCFMGVDMATRKEMIANQIDEADIAAFVGADSLVYLQLDRLQAAVQRPDAKPACNQLGLCHACFSGTYPLTLPSTDASGIGDFDGFRSDSKRHKPVAA